MTESHSINTRLNSQSIHLSPEDNTHLAQLCGYENEHLNMLELRFNVTLFQRGFQFTAKGTAFDCTQSVQALQQLYQEASEQSLSPERVHGLLMSFSDLEPELDLKNPLPKLPESITAGRITVKTRGENQRRYVQRIQTHDLNFGIGPAGTGKTYLAVAAAVQALSNGEAKRIILTRPAVEAGEKLGFLPGDLSQKVDPYLRPLYDALYEMLGVDQVEKLMHKNVIEVAPLAFMRGRTLNHSFMILDEAQNTTPEQMKMFLTRIGLNTKAIAVGDVSQIDLPKQHESGLKTVQRVLANVTGIGFTWFSSKDVVRHALVRKIVDAFHAYEQPSHNKP